MSQQNLEILLRARDEASATINQVKANLAGMKGGTGVLGGGILGGMGGGGEGFLGQLKSVTQAGAAIGAVKAGIAIVGGISSAIKGDWEAVTEACKRLPFGLGEVASVFESIYNSVNGTTEKLEAFEKYVGRIDAQGKKVDVLHGVRKGAAADYAALTMSPEEAQIQGLRDKYNARMDDLNKNSQGLDPVAVMLAGAEAERAMRSGITKINRDKTTQEGMAQLGRSKEVADQQAQINDVLDGLRESARVAEREAGGLPGIATPEQLKALQQQNADLKETEQLVARLKGMGASQSEIAQATEGLGQTQAARNKGAKLQEDLAAAWAAENPGARTMTLPGLHEARFAGGVANQPNGPMLDMARGIKELVDLAKENNLNGKKVAEKIEDALAPGDRAPADPVDILG